MARPLNSLRNRLILTALGLLGLLLPGLFYALMVIVEQSHRDAFVDQVRVYSRFVADSLEAGNDSSARMRRVLDETMLNGLGVYAEVRFPSRTVTSTLSEVDAGDFREDFVFGDHDDRIYFVSVPVEVAGQLGLLRLGFDENPTRNQMDLVRRELLLALGIYLAVNLVLVVWLSGLMVRPLRTLGETSQRIASGNHQERMALETGIVELDEFARDLETMRSELVGTNARLEEEIERRVQAELENEEMQARIRRVQKIESLGTLAGGMAHEFNNVLTPMILYLQLLIDDHKGSASELEDLRRVLALARRAKALVSQILTFSHQNASTEVARTRLGGVVGDAMQMVRAMIPTTVTIDVEPGSGRETVLGDASELTQVVVNLCNNAFLALPEGRGRIGVSVVALRIEQPLASAGGSVEPGDYVRLRVEDDGVGMAPDVLDRIFDPFFTTRPGGEGTGLGLSVVYGIVRSYGGAVMVSSAPGEGTIVDVLIPAVRTALPESEVGHG